MRRDQHGPVEHVEGEGADGNVDFVIARARRDDRGSSPRSASRRRCRRCSAGRDRRRSRPPGAACRPASVSPLPEICSRPDWPLSSSGCPAMLAGSGAEIFAALPRRPASPRRPPSSAWRPVGRAGRSRRAPRPAERAVRGRSASAQSEAADQNRNAPIRGQIMRKSRSLRVKGKGVCSAPRLVGPRGEKSAVSAPCAPKGLNLYTPRLAGFGAEYASNRRAI